MKPRSRHGSSSINNARRGETLKVLSSVRDQKVCLAIVDARRVPLKESPRTVRIMIVKRTSRGTMKLRKWCAALNTDKMNGQCWR